MNREFLKFREGKTLIFIEPAERVSLLDIFLRDREKGPKPQKPPSPNGSASDNALLMRRLLLRTQVRTVQWGPRNSLPPYNLRTKGKV